MARPTLATIAAGSAAWDADVDDNFSKITEAPFPIVVYANVGALPAASSYDDCFALVGTTTMELYLSDGSSWSKYQEAAFVADSTATTAAEMATDFNLLLASLITAGIMAPS